MEELQARYDATKAIYEQWTRDWQDALKVNMVKHQTLAQLDELREKHGVSGWTYARVDDSERAKKPLIREAFTLLPPFDIYEGFMEDHGDLYQKWIRLRAVEVQRHARLFAEADILKRDNVLVVEEIDSVRRQLYLHALKVGDKELLGVLDRMMGS